MRVLHLIHTLDPGGIEKWLLSMLEQLDRGECAADFACKGPDAGSLAGQARNRGAAVHHTPLTPFHLGFVRRVAQVAREGSYDVIHNHLGAYTGAGVWAARRAGLPVITSYHNTSHRAQTRWLRRPGISQLRSGYARLSIGYAARHSDLITGCSQAAIDANIPSGLRDGRCSVLYYGTRVPEPVSEAARTTFREQLGMPAGARIVLHVGSFKKQKNHPGLLDLFQRVAGSVDGARLVMVGDGPLRPEIERDVDGRGLADRVSFLGLRDDVPEIMARSDVFVLPSWFEGFGLVALEANAAGLPVVASAVPGLVEAVVDGATARLFPPEATADMAAAVVELLVDDGRAREMGSAGRRRADAEFSPRASAARMVDLYVECIDRRRNAGSADA